MASARKRERAEATVEECPVCMDPFGSGPHTKVCPFECAGMPHAVCRKCDRTLFLRHADQCPMCRAGRSDGSFLSSGTRGPPPSPERDVDVDVHVMVNPVLGAQVRATAARPADWAQRELSHRLAEWIPRRFARTPRQPVLPVAASHAVGRSGYRRADGTLRWKALASDGLLREGGALAHFTLALFLKELAVVMKTGDRSRIEEFFDGLMTTDFYKEYGLFVVGARIGDVERVEAVECARVGVRLHQTGERRRLGLREAEANRG